VRILLYGFFFLSSDTTVFSGPFSGRVNSRPIGGPRFCDFYPLRGRRRYTIDVSHGRVSIVSPYASDHRNACDWNAPQTRAVRFGFSQGGETNTAARPETTTTTSAD
jgi:hypothetical protein